ncbi:hypothetical protein [uncultured Halopseudomonas sp.]|uniref:hypothetical protein n=1 Tax=uncultured Halopseudomonas sp. TaxID=2901193 RepID=UPI0030EC1762|tara:strand:- start:9842 stop:10081 length:240 start_codon:yes stop_codon:yes gene_type:complete
MRRLFLFAAAFVISTPLFAMHCPADMAKIDKQLESNPPSDPAVLQQVLTLRGEGQQLHEAGKHAESVEILDQAQALLDG